MSVVFDAQPVVLWNLGSKTYHAGYRHEDGHLSTAEACNLDQVRSLEEYPDLPDEAIGQELCKRCFGGRSDR